MNLSLCDDAMQQCTATKIIFVGVTLNIANSAEFERVKNLFKTSENSIRVHISFTSFRNMITLADIITELNHSLSIYIFPIDIILSKENDEELYGFKIFCRRSNPLYEVSPAASVRRMFQSRPQS